MITPIDLMKRYSHKQVILSQSIICTKNINILKNQNSIVLHNELGPALLTFGDGHFTRRGRLRFALDGKSMSYKNWQDATQQKWDIDENIFALLWMSAIHNGNNETILNLELLAQM